MSKKRNAGDEDDKSELPPITPQEEREYGRLGQKMKSFHDWLQAEYEECYTLSDGSFNNRGMTLNHFLVGIVQSFTSHLEAHHNIEERHFFPILAKRMPEFRENEKHKMAHKQIHDGLDKVNLLVVQWKEDPSAYKPDELRGALDSFREPLYRHLAEEVESLSAPNMRKYWTLEDLARMPM